MPSSRESLIENNRKQIGSETDSFTPDRYRQMYRHLPSHAKEIMDVGCNTGRGGSVLKQLNPALRLTGLDCVEERIASLDQNVYERRICSFSNQIPVAGDYLDAILGGEFLEHVPPADVDATLAEFFRILRLRGRVILTTPNPNYLKNKLKNQSVLLEKWHVSQHYPDCLRHRLRAVGFSRVRVYGSGRMTRYVGQRLPFLSVYGSFLIQGDKW
ncbi:MAG TPA: class I SAM-dependent methyltransferase [Verrucomicrobiae bacterium]|nr:class I SAM-dependent methyltransferase [Verrucomicrobiae bacterium]